MNIRIKRTHPAARLPEYASEGAGIAQDLDFVVAALHERLGKGMEQKA